MKRAVAIGLGLLVVTSLPVAAQSRKDIREWHQDRAIEHGLRNGLISPRDADRLERRQEMIDDLEEESRWRNGGYVDGYTRRRLEWLQDQNRDDILHSLERGEQRRYYEGW